MRVIAALALVMVLAGCGKDDPERQVAASPVATVTPAATPPEETATATPAAGSTATPSPTPAARAVPRAAARGIPAFVGDTRIALVDPLTLKRTGPVVALDEPGGGQAPSPSGRYVAAGVGDQPTVEIVDMRRAAVRRIEFGHNGPINGMWWLSERRLAISTGLYAVLHVVDPRTGRRLLRRPLDGVVEVFRGDVALLAPRAGIGPARLALPGGRTVIVPGVRAGTKDLPSKDGAPHVRGVHPALAIDRRGGAAYVAAADSDVVAKVDLRTGASETHLTAVTATAAKELDFRTATAIWLGDGLLAVSRQHNRRERIGQGPLRIVDTRRWRTTVADRRGGYVQAVAGGALLAGADGRLTLFTRTGEVRWRRHIEGRMVPVVQVAGRYVYAQGFGRDGVPGVTHVLDARTGATLRVHVEAPILVLAW